MPTFTSHVAKAVSVHTWKYQVVN